MSAVGVRAWSLAVAGLVASSAAAWAQPAAPSRFEVAVSAGGWGGASLTQSTPTLSGPQLPTGTATPYFTADASLVSGRAAEVRVGWRAWRRLFAEATGGIGWQRLRVDVSRDLEQAPPASPSVDLTQFAVEGGVTAEIPRLAVWRDRLVPFATGGAGYLRQLYEDRVLVESGQTMYAGGGVKWRRRGRARVQPRFFDRFGARGDVRVVWRRGGADPERAWRPTLAVTGGLLLQL